MKGEPARSSRPTLRLLVGPARSGKTGAVVEHVAELLRSGQRVMVILPTGGAVTDFKLRLLNGTGLSAVGCPEIFTFSQLADNVLLRNAPGLRLISSSAQEIILDEIVQRLMAQEALPVLGRLTEFVGLVPALRSWIAELKRGEVTPEAFTSYAAGPSAAPKDAELGRIYAAYQARLHELNVYDPEGRSWHAKEILAARPVEPVVGLETAFVDGFYDFTPMELSVLELMGRYGCRITMTLVGESDPGRSELFRRPQQTLERLKRHFRVDREELAPRHDGHDQLDWLERHLFRHPAPHVPDDLEPCVHFIESPGDLVEMEEIARTIKGPLRRAGLSPADVAVCARNIRDYGGLAAEVFSRFGIPYGLHAEATVADLPVGRLALQILELVTEDFPLSDLASVLRSSLVDLDLILPDSTEVARSLQDVAVEAGLVEGREACGRKLTGLVKRLEGRLETLQEEDEDGSPRYHDPEEVRARIALVRATDVMLGRVFGFLDPLVRARGFQEIAAVVTDTLEVLGVRRRVCQDGESPEGVRTLRSYELLLETLEELTRTAELVGRTTCTTGEFLRELRRLMSEKTLPSTGIEGTGVSVLGIHEARPFSFPVVFVCGLLDRSFPLAHREGPFHDDAERAAMEGAGLNLRPRRAEQSEEAFLFYMACTRARQRLYLTYPVTDREGKPRLVSYYVDEVKRLLEPVADGMLRRVRLDEKVPPAEGLASADELRRRLVTDACHHGDADLSWLGSVSGYLARTQPTALALMRDGLAAEAERDSFRPFGIFDGVISSESIIQELRQRYGPKHAFSASALENYGQCPFRFFCRYVLGLAEPAQTEEELTALEEGRIYHDLFWSFFHELRRRGPDGTALVPAEHERYRDLMRELTGRRLERFRAGRPDLNAVLWDLAAEGIAENAQEFVDAQLERLTHSPGRLPAYLEVSFGLPRTFGHADELSTASRLELEIPDEPSVHIVGKIDRIDLVQGPPAGFIVTDYKTGRRLRGEPDIRQGLFLQLPLYVLAAERVLLREEREALAAELYSLREQRFKPLLQRYRKAGTEHQEEDPAWRELLELATNFVAEYVTGIRRGEFPVLIRGESCPGHCEFRRICRYTERRAFKKQTDWKPWFHRRREEGAR